MANVLDQIPGLGGYLAMQQHQRQSALGDLQGVMGLMSAVRQHQEAQRQAQLAPLQAQMLQTQLGRAQQEAEQEQQASSLLGQLHGQFQQNQGSPEAQRQLFSGMLQNPRLAQMGIQGLTRLDTLQANAQERQAAREQRAQEIATRLTDARLAREERANLQRELAQMQIDARRDMMHLAASLRPPRQEPAPTIVQTEDGPMQVDRQGNARPITGPNGQPVKARTSDRPLTEGQGRAVMFGTRSAQADKVLRSLEDKISTTGLAMKQAVQNTPFIGGVAGAAGNVLLSSEQQRVEQAQRDFVNAILRQESGAVISDAEFANAQKQYFPQPGDSNAVIEQKRKNRQTAINGFRRMAGPGGTDIDAILNEPLMPTEKTPNDPDIEALIRKYSG